jgi:hypothetical protein
MSDELKTGLASVLRITESGVHETHPRVIAEFHGAILYKIKERFRHGRKEYFAPGFDIWNYTNPRLIGLDIDIDFSVSEQVAGNFESFYQGMPSFVGVELWKHLASFERGCEDDAAWLHARYYYCAVRLTEHGHLQVASVSVPKSEQIYAIRYMEPSNYTPKMRGTNDE